jgi:hypothetical protein
MVGSKITKCAKILLNDIVKIDTSSKSESPQSAKYGEVIIFGEFEERRKNSFVSDGQWTDEKEEVCSSLLYVEYAVLAIRCKSNCEKQ